MSDSIFSIPENTSEPDTPHNNYTNGRYEISYNNTPTPPDYLSSLNPAQKQAVETTQGALLVLAGAGTGKTRVLTTRLAHIINTGLAFPGQILAVTFTNKAAQEMKERVSALLGGQPVEGWWLGTFHSIANRMLRNHASLAGLSSGFTILDADDQLRLIKQIMEGMNLNTKKNSPKIITSIINTWKDKALTSDTIEKTATKNIADGKLPLIYRQYQQRLKTLNACDFGDLLLHVINILRKPENTQILEDYQRRFKYILVDEYQDTNTAQYMWLRLLAGKNGNICCVGDDDQSIYGWRGAEIENILRFEKDFPNAKIIRLEQNYRSTGHILAAANGLIAHNTQRMGKNLFTGGEKGEKILINGLWDAQAESDFVAREIEHLRHKNINLNQISILVRAGFQMREFEEKFIQKNIPYKVIGGPRFYERMEIRDALAYLRIISQKNDDLALERIINKPKRGIGLATMKTLHENARNRNISLYQSIQDIIRTGKLRPKLTNTLTKLIDDFERWSSMLDNTNHAQLAETILHESGYIDMWKNDKSPDSDGRVENLKELVSAISEFDSMTKFLEHVALVMENQSNQTENSVTLMTFHAAKGLEYEYVFLTGWEEGLFPSQRTIDENGIKGLEEERRLAYVGITRARKKAYITYVANRMTYGKYINAIPSRFIDELPEENIIRKNETGIYKQQNITSPGNIPTTSFPAGNTRTTDSTNTDTPLKRGVRVHHNTFGDGTIINIQGNKLDIAFDNGDHKRIMDSFVTLLQSS